MQDVEGLHGMKRPVSLVLSKDRVVCPVVPLQQHTARMNAAKDAGRRLLQSIQEVTWLRSAEKGAGSQATSVPEL